MYYECCKHVILSDWPAMPAASDKTSEQAKTKPAGGTRYSDMLAVQSRDIASASWGVLVPSCKL